MMVTAADVDWNRLEDRFGRGALLLRDSMGVGRGYRAGEFAADNGLDEATVEALLEAVADHGLLSRRPIWVCRQEGHVLDSEPHPSDTECPVGGEPYEGRRPVESVQYLVVTPPRRSVPAVIAVHGMNTRGAWQERLGFLLSSMHGRSIPMAIYKYGLIVPGVILRWRQRQLTRKLITQLKLVAAELGERPFGSRPDVIAHSFGTWLLYRALETDETLRVGHVILTGCVVPPDARWDKFGDRVGPVLNHYGAKDPWARIAAYVIPGSGPAGRRGFNAQPGVLQVRESDYGHSDYFFEENIDEVFARVWEPFLLSPASDVSSLDPKLFASTHPAGAPDWKGVPRIFRAGVARWLAVLFLAIATLVLVAVGLPVGLALGLSALPVGLVLTLVAMLGAWRGWDR